MIRKSLQVLCVLGQVPLGLGTIAVVALHAPAAVAQPTKPPAAPPTPAAAAPTSATGAPVPAAAAAAPPLPPGVPKPPVEMDQLKVLEGSWRCEGRAPATVAGPEHAYKSTWKLKRELDNFWWLADYQQAKSKTNPTPMKARGYLTYDPTSKMFVLLGVDNMGGTSTETSSGWSGDTLTLAGEASMGGRKVPFREIITRRSEREFTWRGEMRGSADWVTLGEDRCKK